MPTIQEIASVMQEMEKAMLDHINLSKDEEKIKLEKAKAHKRLSLARDEVRALTQSLL